MMFDWSIAPAFIWYVVTVLVIIGVVALIIEVADWSAGHHDFVHRHTPHWFDDDDE
jgi:hypothetical protein